MTYDKIRYTIADICDGVEYDISALSNIASLLYQEIRDINWVGFYLLRDGKLILGPFQGKLACTEIELGKGACGKSAANNEPVLLWDVSNFDGYIACDPETKSEVVLPIYKNGALYGVLDIDSATLSRFNGRNIEGYVELAGAVTKVLTKTKA